MQALPRKAALLLNSILVGLSTCMDVKALLEIVHIEGACMSWLIWITV
jgi:hypothetical protein